MKIALHLGAHATDEDRLVRTLLRNREDLAAEGIAVPQPARYRDLLGDVLAKLQGATASADTESMLIEELHDGLLARRIVLSHDSFLCGPNKIVDGGTLYAKAGVRAGRLRKLFPDHEVEFFLGIRNPATFLPEAALLTRARNVPELLAGMDPRRFRWSDAVGRVRDGAPDVPLTVWCNEDTPLLWPEILRAVTDHRPDTRLRASLAILGGIMQPDGFARLRAVLDRHTPRSDARRRNLFAAYLSRYALEERTLQKIDLPGWTTGLVDEITRAYDADLAIIASIPGVRLMLP